MSIADKIVAAVAWTLPDAARRRYREEWLADLVGARELELSQWTVVGGAVTAAVAIDRTDPRVTGITKARLVANRMRWAGALLGSAAVLGVGLFLWGGYESFLLAPIGFGVQFLAVVLGILGLFACLGAIVVAFDTFSKRTVLSFGVGALVVVVLMISGMLMPLFGVLAVPLVIAAMIVSISSKGAPLRSQQLSKRSRILIAVPFSLLALLLVVAGVLHITVWNPLAAVPGLSLDEIYSAMSAANESPLIVFIAVWAAFWAAAAVMFPILGSVQRFASFLTARRIVVIGLLLVSATVFFQWFAGFNMGMSLADTFMVGGSDAAMSGPAIALVGQTALIAALLIGVIPRRNTATFTPALPSAPER